MFKRVLGSLHVTA